MRYFMLRFPEGKRKAFTMSYDDGVKHDIKFIETINRYGLKATFNLNNAYFDNNGRNLTEQEVKDYILANGHEIAVHGEFHKAPGIVSAKDGIIDVLNCRMALEKLSGKIIRGMAYPDSGITLQYNNNYDNIKKYLTDLGIVYSRSLAQDNNAFLIPTDWHNWIPTAHHKNAKVLDYLDEFVNMNISAGYLPTLRPRLFYLWGHTYEFNDDNNWDLLETICQKVSNNDDIWYATNIEIYDYVTAYNSLVFSADNSMVYNPTLKTIWFTVDNVLHKINSGETITLL